MPPRTTLPLEEQTEQALQRHLNAFGTGEVDAIMTDYAEEAVFVTPDGILRGKSEIRPLFEELVVDLPPGSIIDIKRQHVAGELAYLVWAGESEKLCIPFATDTLIVQNGKIVQQTFAAQIEVKEAASF